ncbi:MAG: Lrp/AsnC family transcriptional regulator, partial [Nitrososphaerales archaeon]
MPTRRPKSSSISVTLPSNKIEDKDNAILMKLRLDSSKPVSEIASDLGMPRTTVQERMKKLTKEGVIRKFTVQLDYSK